MTDFDYLRDHLAAIDKQRLDAFTTVVVQTLLSITQMQEILRLMDKDGEYDMHLEVVTRCLNNAAEAAEPLIHHVYAAWQEETKEAKE